MGKAIGYIPIYTGEGKAEKAMYPLGVIVDAINKVLEKEGYTLNLGKYDEKSYLGEITVHKLEKPKEEKEL